MTLSNETLQSSSIANEANLSCLSNSINKLNKLVNADLKDVINWLNANKISLSVKTKLNCNL